MGERLIDNNQQDIFSPIHTVDFRMNSPGSDCDFKRISKCDGNSYILLIKPCTLPDYFDKHYLSLKEKNLVRRNSVSKGKKVKYEMRKSYTNFDSYIRNPSVQSSMSSEDLLSLSHISLSDSFAAESNRSDRVEKILQLCSVLERLVNTSVRPIFANIRSCSAYKTPNFTKINSGFLSFSCSTRRYNKFESFATKVVRNQFSFFIKALEDIYLKRSFALLKREDQLIKKFFGNAVRIFSSKLAKIARTLIEDAFFALKIKHIALTKHHNFSFKESMNITMTPFSPILKFEIPKVTSPSIPVIDQLQLTKSYSSIQSRATSQAKRSNHKVDTNHSYIRRSHNYKYLAHFLSSNHSRKSSAAKTDLSHTITKSTRYKHILM